MSVTFHSCRPLQQTTRNSFNAYIIIVLNNKIIIIILGDKADQTAELFHFMLETRTSPGVFEFAGA